MDETWIFSRDSKIKSWQGSSVKSIQKPEGFVGKRFIILHAGLSKGCVKKIDHFYMLPSKKQWTIMEKRTTIHFGGECVKNYYQFWRNHLYIEPIMPIYEIDEVIQKNWHEVLRLLPYHCQFNAFELIWVNCKLV